MIETTHDFMGKDTKGKTSATIIPWVKAVVQTTLDVF